MIWKGKIMSCKRTILTGLLVFALVATVQADVDPADSDSNILILVISRPNMLYHDGDTIEYTVTVTVPPADIGFGKPARQEDVDVTFNAPDGAGSVTFPTIASLNRGESVVFTSSDDALLGYVVVHADESSSEVTADANAMSAIAHTTESDNDSAFASRDITTMIVHPDILIVKESDVIAICDGVTTEVTYTYYVSWGVGADVDLIEVEATDDMCGPLVRQADDTGNDDDVLEEGETWVYECVTSISAETTNVATADANDASGFHVSDTDTITITASESPSVSIDPNAGEICDGDSFEFCAVGSGGTPPYTYAWEKDGSFFEGDVECINPSEAGEYSVIVTDSLGCVSNEASAPLTVNPNPECSISLDAPPVCPSEGGNFLSSEVTSGTPEYSYLWEIIAGSGWAIVGSDSGDSLEYSVGEEASACATFRLTVTDSKGCTTVCELEVCCIGDTFCSFTQGFWGNAGGRGCNGWPTPDLIQVLLDLEGPVVVGLPGRSITFDSNDCIILRLPAGGKPRALPNNLGDVNCDSLPNNVVKKKEERINNVLVGQVVALSLNVRLHGVGCVEGVSDLGSFVLPDEFCTLGDDGCPEKFFIPESLVGLTVNELLALANEALGGEANELIGDLYEAASAINEGFDECRSVIACPTEEICDNGCDDDFDGLVDGDDPDCEI